MTTIAYRNGIMASDSCWSYNDTVDTMQTKMRRLKGGCIIGSAGTSDSRDVEALFDKVKTPAGLPSPEALGRMRCDYLGLLVLPKGRLYKVCCTGITETNWDGERDAEFGLWEISFDFAAVGSGAPVALGALSAGKNAKEAVRIACMWDLYSKAPVHVMPLLKPTIVK